MSTSCEENLIKMEQNCCRLSWWKKSINPLKNYK